MNQINPAAFTDVDGAIRAATDAILSQQKPDGHWVYELEADATIPAEYVLLVHYLAETPNLELEKKIGAYLRRIQGAHGGWPLYHEGAFDISATVKAYFALKMIGDDINAPHMVRAREAVRERGGAIKANVFTRILLALYGETSWQNVPPAGRAQSARHPYRRTVRGWRGRSFAARTTPERGLVFLLSSARQGAEDRALAQGAA
jgi:squalene-hopene/tetraprenyl-beta-curcumene cyclase